MKRMLFLTIVLAIFVFAKTANAVLTIIDYTADLTTKFSYGITSNSQGAYYVKPNTTILLNVYISSTRYIQSMSIPYTHSPLISIYAVGSPDADFPVTKTETTNQSGTTSGTLNLAATNVLEPVDNHQFINLYLKTPADFSEGQYATLSINSNGSGRIYNQTEEYYLSGKSFTFKYAYGEDVVPTFEFGTVTNNSIELKINSPATNGKCKFYRRNGNNNYTSSEFACNGQTTYTDSKNLTSGSEYSYILELVGGGKTAAATVTTLTEYNPPSVTYNKGDWNHSGVTDVTDVISYRKYLAGEEERVTIDGTSKAYSEFESDHKKALDYNDNNIIDLIDLINVRIQVAQ